MSSFDSFITSWSKPLPVPSDIILLIQLFFGSRAVGWNIALFCFKRYRLYNPTWNINKLYGFNVAIIDQIIPPCIVDNVSLPKFIQRQCKSHSFPMSSSEWSMMFQFGNALQMDTTHRFYSPFDKFKNTGYYVTAFHSDLLSTNRWSDKYVFKLPSISRYIMKYSPSMIYNKHEGILYTANMKSIYSLNLNVRNNCEWNTITDNLLIERYNASLCMVDNDRFIAILGGNNKGHTTSNNAELYAINCNKSILINGIHGKYTQNDISLYHHNSHRIFICNTDWYGDMEWYDINKDKWIKLKYAAHFAWNKPYRQTKQIVVDERNHNMILICSVVHNIDSKDEYEIYEMDLRTDINKTNCIWTHYDGYLGLSATNICLLQM